MQSLLRPKYNRQYKVKSINMLNLSNLIRIAKIVYLIKVSKGIIVSFFLCD